MLNYTIKTFRELSLDELYMIMAIRQEVFVLEQDCPYLDADGKDQMSHHVIGYDPNNNIHAYARLVPPGISYDDYSSIGRVVTSLDYRRKGEGKRLMEISTNAVKNIFPNIQIKISAQVYAIPFYQALGYEEIGERYDEDNIPHAAMIYSEL